MEAKTIGLIVGFIVGLLIDAILIIMCNKNKKLKTEYDERQKIIRGEAYKYGFYFAMIYTGLIAILSITELDMIFTLDQLLISGIILSVTLVCAYSIWNNAYWGLNNDTRKYKLVFFAGFILNAIVVIIAFANGEMIIDGKFQTQFVNLMCTCMFLILTIVMIAKKKATESDEANED